MVTVEELKENFVTREVKPYGTCVCIPNKEFKPEWENELRSQGFKVFAAFFDQAPFMLVQLKPAKFSDEKRRWSKEDDEKLVDLWNKGLGVNEIAAKFSDRSIHSVKMRIDRLKVKGVIHSRWQKRYRKHPPERRAESIETPKPAESAEIPEPKLNQTILLVEFKDARSEPTLWEKDLDQIQLPTYLAVGFLTKETSEYIALSQGFLPKADIIDENAYRNILFIPKAVITKTMEIKV